MLERKRVQIFFDEPSLTRQEFKDQCDLGKLLKRFCQTPEGLAALQNAQGHVPGSVFADVSAVPDYRQYRDAVNAAEASFMALPATVRRRFNHDTAEFMDFISDSSNRDEAKALGLLREEPQVSESPAHVPT